MQRAGAVSTPGRPRPLLGAISETRDNGQIWEGVIRTEKQTKAGRILSPSLAAVVPASCRLQVGCVTACPLLPDPVRQT